MYEVGYYVLDVLKAEHFVDVIAEWLMENPEKLEELGIEDDEEEEE